MLLKLLHITLAIHILFASLGIKIEKHFCGKELQTVKLFEEKKACCSSNSNDDNTCCHNDIEFLDLEQSTSFVKSSFDFLQIFAPYPTIYKVFIPFQQFTFSTFIKEKVFFISSHTLQHTSIPLFIKYHTLII
jgi:hypothetical protein